MTIKFHYSSYWHNWSRVLKPFGETFTSSNGVVIGPSHCVEISLTPINGWSSKSGVDVIKEERIRRHFTPRGRSDKESLVLPLEVITQMKLYVNLGSTLAARLLTWDYMSHIDWDLQRTHSNGGCPIRKCLLGMKHELDCELMHPNGTMCTCKVCNT